MYDAALGLGWTAGHLSLVSEPSRCCCVAAGRSRTAHCISAQLLAVHFRRCTFVGADQSSSEDSSGSARARRGASTSGLVPLREGPRQTLLHSGASAATQAVVGGGSTGRCPDVCPPVRSSPTRQKFRLAAAVSLSRPAVDCTFLRKANHQSGVVSVALTHVYTSVPTHCSVYFGCQVLSFVSLAAELSGQLLK